MPSRTIRQLTITAELEERAADERPELTAYVLTRSGRLLDQQPFEFDKQRPTFATAKLKLETDPATLSVKVGPPVADVEALRRLDLPTERLVVPPEGPLDLAFTIPKPWWRCWIKLPYLVRGTVELQGAGGVAPICYGEVDIYDVDLGYCFPRLPDHIIERVREAMIDVILDPPPLVEQVQWPRGDDDDWCGTGRRPPRPPLSVNDDLIKRLDTLPASLSFAKARFTALPAVRAKADALLGRMSTADQQAFLNREAVKDVRISEILYSNTAQLRELLNTKFLAFRYWLCWYPWIYWLWWPYCRWYSLEKLGTAQLQPDGTFAKTIRLSICPHDAPDLWFVVRQQVGGVERVIYARHPVPCNTYWNHASNTPVRLLVTDPLAVACDPTVDPGAPGIYVMPLGIGWDRWDQITQAHRQPAGPGQPLPARDANRGLYNGTDPYGTTLHLRMQFHDGLRAIGVGFYRWSFRKEGEAWTQIDAPVVHSYLTTDSSGQPFMDYEQLGPKPAPVGSEFNLFLVPDPAKDWVYDRVFAYWDTKQLEGNYELLLEMFDSNGAKITPAAGFTYFLPTGPAPSPVDNTLYVEAEGGIIFQIHIDNQVTRADVSAITLGGVKALECQFLAYALKTELVGVEYVAYHPNGFLDHYDLSVLRGISGTGVAALSSTTPAATTTTQTWTVDHLLRQVNGNGPHNQCTFAVELHTWPRTRDGYTRIRAYEAHDTATFAIVKA